MFDSCWKMLYEQGPFQKVLLHPLHVFTLQDVQTKKLLGAPGLTTRNKKLLGAPGIATRSKDTTRGS